MASTACLLQPAAAAASASAPAQLRQRQRRPHQEVQRSSKVGVASTTQSQCLGRRRATAVASVGGEMRTGAGFDLSGLDFGAETDVRLGFQPPRSSLVSPSSSVVEPARAMLAAAAMEADPASILLQQRVVFLSTQVDDFSADLLISQLLLLDAQDPDKDIRLLINSPGGSVTAGMGIYDAMKLCRADVSTICIGLAASMGAFLLAAGAKGKRYAMPNSRIMIHQPLGGAQGSAIDVGLQVREMMYHKIKLNKILSRATGKPEEQIEIDTDRDNFMSAWEARDYGLVDAVLNEDNPKLVAPIGEAREPPKTRVWDLWTIKEGRERRRLPGEQNLLKS